MEAANKAAKAGDKAKAKKLADKLIDKGVKDPVAVAYVSEMLFRVEHSLADGRDPTMNLYPPVGCLNSEEYYRDVFGEETDETRRYRELGKRLKKAAGMLV